MQNSRDPAFSTPLLPDAWPADKIPAMETLGLSPSRKDEIRIQFYREFRGAHGCSSVGIAADDKDGAIYLNVGLVDDGARIPAEYEGLPVRTYPTGRALHAVHHAR
jgi:hypothetical protein